MELAQKIPDLLGDTSAVFALDIAKLLISHKAMVAITAS
jgi:hypothetical protein